MTSLEIDVHQKTVEESKDILLRAIERNPQCIEIKVIHGYINGRKIKEYLATHGLSHPRIRSIGQDFFNQGVTIISLWRSR